MELPQVTNALIDQGERMAFHGRPSEGVGPLRTAVELSRANEDQSSVQRATWLLGVCHASVGEYNFAMAELVPLSVLATQQKKSNKWAVLSCTTMGSVYRQQQAYAKARQCDEWALAGCDTTTRFDALIGLAADSVGDGEADNAEEFWAASHDVSDDEWRQVVRLAWVEAEIALLRSDAERAAHVSSAAAELSARANAPRHQAKSLLFAGVALADLGDYNSATSSLNASIDLSRELNATPLLEPASQMLARLEQSASLSRS